MEEGLEVEQLNIPDFCVYSEYLVSGNTPSLVNQP